MNTQIFVARLRQYTRVVVVYHTVKPHLYLCPSTLFLGQVYARIRMWSVFLKWFNLHPDVEEKNLWPKSAKSYAIAIGALPTSYIQALLIQWYKQNTWQTINKVKKDFCNSNNTIYSL